MPMLGHVTSSYFSPELNRSIALAVVRDGIKRRSEEGVKAGRDVLYAWAGGKSHKVKVVSPVFVDPEEHARMSEPVLQSPFTPSGFPRRRDPRTKAAACGPTRFRSRATSAYGATPADTAFQDGAASALGTRLPAKPCTFTRSGAVKALWLSPTSG